jgi:hypothetical protein
MCSNYNDTNLPNYATEIIKAQEVFDLNMLNPLLVRARLKVMLVAVMHLRQHGPLARHTMLRRNMVC